MRRLLRLPGLRATRRPPRRALPLAPQLEEAPPPPSLVARVSPPRPAPLGAPTTELQKLFWGGEGPPHPSRRKMTHKCS